MQDIESGFPTDFSPLLQDLYILAKSCTDTVSGEDCLLIIVWDFQTNLSLSWTDPTFTRGENPQPPQKGCFCETGTPTPERIIPIVWLYSVSAQSSGQTPEIKKCIFKNWFHLIRRMVWAGRYAATLYPCKCSNSSPVNFSLYYLYLLLFINAP